MSIITTVPLLPVHTAGVVVELPVLVLHPQTQTLAPFVILLVISAHMVGTYPPALVVVNLPLFIPLIHLTTLTSKLLSLRRFPGASAVVRRTIRVATGTSGLLRGTIARICTACASILRLWIPAISAVAATVSQLGACLVRRRECAGLPVSPA